MITKGLLSTVLLLPLLSPALAGEAGEWRLVGRKGECAPLSLLEKKGPEFRGVESPKQLAEKMRAAGHKVEVKEYNLAKPPAVEVRVPDRGIYLMFRQAELCDKSEAPETSKTTKSAGGARKR